MKSCSTDLIYMLLQSLFQTSTEATFFFPRKSEFSAGNIWTLLIWLSNGCKTQITCPKWSRLILLMYFFFFNISLTPFVLGTRWGSFFYRPPCLTDEVAIGFLGTTWLVLDLFAELQSLLFYVASRLCWLFRCFKWNNALFICHNMNSWSFRKGNCFYLLLRLLHSRKLNEALRDVFNCLQLS